MPSLCDITLAVLAGGEGSRMGVPKAMLSVEGRPILKYLIDEIAWPGPTRLITAPGRERPPGAEWFGREIADPVAGLGPLRGVLTALETADTPLSIVVTVDMPRIRAEHLRWIAARLNDEANRLGAMCRRAVDGELQIEPFPLALRSQGRSVVAEALAAGRRSVHGLLEAPGFEAFDAPADWQSTVWTNLNFPRDLAGWKP